MRAARANKSTSATAVLRALLALSSLHRYGVQSQAVELKISSLKALAAASISETSLGVTEVIQHIAAGMLLCSFEVRICSVQRQAIYLSSANSVVAQVHQSSCTSSSWAYYIAGVKQLIDASSIAKPQEHDDLAALLDWLYYHDVMMRFTLRHWGHGDAEMLSLNPSSTSKDVYARQMPRIFMKRSCISQQPPSTSALPELLSEFFDSGRAPSPDKATSQALEDYKSFLTVLDWRIRTVPVLLKPDEPVEMSTTVELYRLAIHVYVNRVSDNFLGQTVRTQQRIDEGFALLSHLPSCERQFPIFVLGCEAGTDDQRAIILDLISRTEKKITSRSFNHVTVLLHALWAQDDLADGGLDYLNKLNSLISRCTIVPSLV